MRRLFTFSETTFCAMSKEQQHKKCSELLRELHTNTRKEALQQEYDKLCLWMGLPKIAWNFEAVEQRFHEHVRNSGRSLSEHDFLQHVSVGDKDVAKEWLGIHTYLDGLRSCHNVGSIVRTVEAFRLGPIHLSPDMMPHDHPQIQKTSMGSWKFVSLTHGIDTTFLPRPWIAIETITGAPAYNEWIYPHTGTLFVGNEERGIRPSVLNECDNAITIPLAGHKNSLNVANAFAIVAAHIASQQKRTVR